MSLRKELKELQRQRREELAALTRAARQTRRRMSPERLIRAYPYPSLAAAAVAGILLAPAPKYVRAEPAGRARRRGPGVLLKLLRRVIPKEYAEMFAQAEGGEAAPAAEVRQERGEERAPRRSMVETVLMQALPLLMTQIDFQGILKAWLEGMRRGPGEGEAAAAEAGAGVEKDSPGAVAATAEAASHDPTMKL